MVPASIEIQNSGFSVQMTVANTSQHKLKVPTPCLFSLIAEDFGSTMMQRF